MSAETMYDARVMAPVAHRLERPVEQWEQNRRAKQRVAALLHELPTGFVVFHDIKLPKPSRATVDHLVIGPRNVWAVTTELFDDPVVHGRGRNADTLWSGRTPLRTVLDAADWEASALSALLGHTVEPVVCLVAPSLPEPAFDFHGIRICRPEALTRQVAVSTADFVDVASVVDAVERVFGTEPATVAALPKLESVGSPFTGTASLAPQRRRTFGARLHALRRRPAVRTGALVALLALLVAALPLIVDVWTSVADEGATRISSVIDESGGAIAIPVLVDPVVGTPPPVGYELTCVGDSSAWSARWAWPGDLPDGVTGYSVRTRSNGGPPVLHTLLPWSDASQVPPSVRIADPSSTTILTDYRTADGRVVATTASPMFAPDGSC